MKASFVLGFVVASLLTIACTANMAPSSDTQDDLSSASSSNKGTSDSTGKHAPTERGEALTPQPAAPTEDAGDAGDGGDATEPAPNDGGCKKSWWGGCLDDAG